MAQVYPENASNAVPSTQGRKPGDSSSRSTDGRRFFFLLILATLIPFVAMPLYAYVVPDAGAARYSRELLMFIGSAGHVGASFFFYSDSRLVGHMSGHRTRYYAVPAFLVLGTAALYGLVDAEQLAYFSILYWIWQTYHYALQNLGVLAFVSRGEGVPVLDVERWAIRLTGAAASIGMITFVTPYESTFLEPYAWHIHKLALIVYVAAWGCGLFAFISNRRTPLRSLVLGILLLFFLPLFVFENRLAAVSSYAIAHGLQYLVFMAYVSAVPRAERFLRAAQLTVFVLAGGALLNGMAYGWAGPASWHQPMFGAYLGLVMWHFVLDAGVWRLREPFQRQYMSERFSCLRQ